MGTEETFHHCIVEFDASEMRGHANSGSVYHLRGKPGCSDNGEYVWSQWARINSASDYVDVGDSIWQTSQHDRH